jgi:membrane protein
MPAMSRQMRLWRLVRGTVTGFVRDDALRHSASLAFYALFSLAPLLIIVMAIAGAAFGAEAVAGRLERTLAGFVGPESAKTLQSMVEGARRPMDSLLAAGIGIVTLLFGASGVFAQLRATLDEVWGLEREPRRGLRTVWSVVLARLVSFAMVLCVGFLLLVSLVVTTLLDVFHESISGSWPLPAAVWQVVHVVVSLAMIALLFALIFRHLSDAVVPWRDAWRGGLLTAVLFSGGKQLLGLYLARESAASAYGAAGSVIVILLWVFFSSITVIAGAEFMRVRAELAATGRTGEPHTVSESRAERFEELGHRRTTAAFARRPRRRRKPGAHAGGAAHAGDGGHSGRARPAT